MTNILLPDGDIIFRAKPDAVPYNYRISYKVAQLCMIMSICGRVGKCSLIKLQMISFALLSEKNMSNLIEFAEGKEVAPTVRFDPSVNRGITFVLVYGFAEQLQTGNYKLTSKGNDYVNRIVEDGTLMISEIEYLRSLSKKLTESKINNLANDWRKKYAAN